MSFEDEFIESSRPSPEDNSPDADYTLAAAAYFSEVDTGSDIDRGNTRMRLAQHGIDVPGVTTAQPDEQDLPPVTDLDARRRTKK